MIATTDQLTALREIHDVIANMSLALDSRDYEGWLDAFLPDAPYSAITAESLALDGPSLFMDFGIDGRKERVAFWLGLWQVTRGRIRHILGSSVLVAEDEKSHRVATPFLMSRNGADGLTVLHCSGVYNDDWVRTGEGWKLAWRRVVVDCDTLPANFTDPL